MECGASTYDIVSVLERSNGVDSSSTVFALVGSNPTADMLATFVKSLCARCFCSLTLLLHFSFNSVLFILLLYDTTSRISGRPWRQTVAV